MSATQLAALGGAGREGRKRCPGPPAPRQSCGKAGQPLPGAGTWDRRPWGGVVGRAGLPEAAARPAPLRASHLLVQASGSAGHWRSPDLPPATLGGGGFCPRPLSSGRTQVLCALQGWDKASWAGSEAAELRAASKPRETQPAPAWCWVLGPVCPGPQGCSVLERGTACL